MCGEKCVLAPNGAAVKGITPACAGKSHDKDKGAEGKRDHPRMCGEKAIDAGRTFAESGSPPHVRGKDASSGARGM